MDNDTAFATSEIELFKQGVPGGIVNVHLNVTREKGIFLNFVLFLDGQQKPHSINSYQIDGITLSKIQELSAQTIRWCVEEANRNAVFGQFVKSAVQKGMTEVLIEERDKIENHIQSLLPLALPFEWDDSEEDG